MAVYTEVSSDELAGFVARYGLGELLSYKGIAEGVENTNYAVHTGTGEFILTLYEKRVDPNDLPFFLGLMEHLASRGVSCPLPVKTADGATLSELSGRAAAIVTFLEGYSIRTPDAENCGAVGRALAQLHLAGQGFPLTRRNALGLRGWRPLFERFRASADEISPGLGQLIADDLSILEARWPAGLPAGVIHADLFPDNVFFRGHTLSGLIDFYFACNDAFAYDLAICLNAWCFEPDYRFNADKGRALLEGYDAVRALTPDERAQMPLLARGAAMRFLLTRSFDWLNTAKDALVTPHNPLDYLARLRFHQTAGSIADYGLSSDAR